MILAKQQRLAYELGSRLFWTLTLQVYVPHVCYSDEGALSHVLENENILNRKLIIPIPQIKFTLCKVIAANYAKMGKVIQELHWTALALRYAREAGGRTDISQATCVYLKAMAKIPIPKQEQSQRASRLLATYYLAIDKDRDYGHIKDQFDLHWYLLQERLTFPITKIEVDEVADRAQFLAQSLAEDGINRCLADISWLRGDISIDTGEFESALEIYKQNNMRPRMSAMRFKIAQTHMFWWNHKVAEGFFDWQLLATAKQVFGSANDMFEDLGNFVQADHTQYYLGIICSNRLKFIDPSDTSVADECLGHLAAAISLRDHKRLEIPTSCKPTIHSL